MSLAVSGGWLQKLGTNNRWQKRWFHVRDGTLVYATKVGGDGNASKRFDMDDVTATPLDGDVLRQMAAPAPPSGFTFVFRLSEQSGAKMRRGSADAARATLTLAAASEEIRNQWVASILQSGSRPGWSNSVGNASSHCASSDGDSTGRSEGSSTGSSLFLSPPDTPRPWGPSLRFGRKWPPARDEIFARARLEECADAALAAKKCLAAVRQRLKGQIEAGEQRFRDFPDLEKDARSLAQHQARHTLLGTAGAVLADRNSLALLESAPDSPDSPESPLLDALPRSLISDGGTLGIAVESALYSLTQARSDRAYAYTDVMRIVQNTRDTPRMFNGGVNGPPSAPALKKKSKPPLPPAGARGIPLSILMKVSPGASPCGTPRNDTATFDLGSARVSALDDLAMLAWAPLGQKHEHCGPVAGRQSDPSPAASNWSSEQGSPTSEPSPASAGNNNNAVARPMSSIHAIAERFRSGLGSSGLVSDRMFGLKTYNQVFVGSTAVSWLMEAGIAVDEKAAVALGQRLVDECRLFQHVTHAHGFKNQFLFYRFRTADAAGGGGGGQVGGVVAGGAGGGEQTGSNSDGGVSLSGWHFKQPEVSGWGTAQRRWFELSIDGQLRWSETEGGRSKGSLEFVAQGYHFEETLVEGFKYSFRLTPSLSTHGRVYILSPEDNTLPELVKWRQAFKACTARMLCDSTADNTTLGTAVGRTGSLLSLITTDLPYPDPWPADEPWPESGNALTFGQLAALQYLCKVPSWRRAEQRLTNRGFQLRGDVGQPLGLLTRIGMRGLSSSSIEEPGSRGGGNGGDKEDGGKCVLQ